MIGVAAAGLSQKSDVGEDCLGRSLPVAKVDRLLVIADAVLVESDEQLEHVLPAGHAQVPGVGVVSVGGEEKWNRERERHFRKNFKVL